MGSNKLTSSVSMQFHHKNNSSPFEEYQTVNHDLLTPPQKTQYDNSNKKQNNKYGISPDILKPFPKTNSLAPPSLSPSGSTVFSNTKKGSTLYSESERDIFDEADEFETSFRKLVRSSGTQNVRMNPQSRQFLDDFELDTDEDENDCQENFLTNKLSVQNVKKINIIDFELNDIQETFENNFHLLPDTNKYKSNAAMQKTHGENNPFLLQPRSMINLRQKSDIPRTNSISRLPTTQEHKPVKTTTFNLANIQDMRQRLSQPQLPRFKSMSNLKLGTLSSTNNDNNNNNNYVNNNVRKLKNKQSVPNLPLETDHHLFSGKQKLNKFQAYDNNMEDVTFENDFEQEVLPNYLKTASSKKSKVQTSSSNQPLHESTNFFENEKFGHKGFENSVPFTTPKIRNISTSTRWKSKQHHLSSFREEDVEDGLEFGHHPGFRKPSNIQLLKQEIDSNTPITKGKMIYNPETFKWEGNIEALNEFPQSYKARLNKKRSLSAKASDIKLTKSGSTLLSKYTQNDKNNHIGGLQSRKIVGNMQFDSKNQRWVSVHGDADEIDPFKNIEDHVLAQSSSYGGSRFPSSATDSNLKKYVSSSSSKGSGGNLYNRHASMMPLNPTFIVSSKRLEVFYHEENKWIDKLNGWVCEDLQVENADRYEYAYEIRNMVLSSTKK